MAIVTSERIPPPPILGRIIPVIILLGILAFLGYSLTDGAANSRFLQVGAALGLLVYLVTFVDVVIGLAFLILFVGISPEVSMAGLNDLRLEDFVVPALLLAWLTRALQGREKLANIPFKGPAIAYFATLVFSTLLGAAAGTANLSLAVPLIAKSVEYYLILLIVANNIRTENEFRALVIFTILVAMASTFFATDRIVSESESTLVARMHGPLGETANIFGGYLILNLAIGIGIFLHSQSRGARVVSGAAVTVLCAATLYTYSRTSYAAAAAGLMLFGVLRERRVLLIILLLAMLLPMLAPDAVLARMGTIGDIATGPGPASWVSRLYAWQSTVERMSGMDFFWGRGAGSVRLGDVDNEYVRVLSDTGLLGLGLFVGMLVSIGRSALRHYDRLAPPTFHKGFAAGYLIALFSLVVHAVAATSFTSIRTMEGFMLLTGFFVCQAHHRSDWNLEQGVTSPVKEPVVLLEISKN